MLVGILAILFPMIMAVALEQFLGVLSLVLGAVVVVGALVGKISTHRLSAIGSGVVLVVLGIALLIFVKESLVVLALLLAAAFLIEGIAGVVGAFRFRSQMPAWPMMLLNGVLALVIAVLLAVGWPLRGEVAIGLLYGINMLFAGIAFLSVAMSGGSSPRV